MKNSIKTYIIIALAGVCAFLYFTLQSETRTKETWKDKYEFENRQVDFWKTENDFGKARIENLEIEKKDIKKVLGSLADSLEKEIDGLKAKNVKGATIYKIVYVYDTIEVPILVENGIKTFNEENRWLTLRGNILEDRVVFSKISVSDSVSVIDYYKREGLFKKKRYVEVTSHNPYSKFTQLQQFSVAENRSKITVGPYVGVGVGRDLVPGVQVGIGVQYPLIRF